MGRPVVLRVALGALWALLGCSLGVVVGGVDKVAPQTVPGQDWQRVQSRVLGGRKGSKTKIVLTAADSTEPPTHVIRAALQAGPPPTGSSDPISVTQARHVETNSFGCWGQGWRCCIW